ncbi:DUF397 domain-containing protein [Streptomyces hygroscopicus]|uniref:DUF397 domain-containing protein n=1 Tax=Streptomyces hygroscopicus TaxID=1912 RepID=UPI000AF041BC|nr:DUF397 domain-containing protein [Streptomyces hygroscopicus]
MTHRIAPDIAPERAWFKSSHSEANGTACVEIAHLPDIARVGIRDSKDKGGPVLVVTAGAWAEFVAAVRTV